MDWSSDCGSKISWAESKETKTVVVGEWNQFLNGLYSAYPTTAYLEQIFKKFTTYQIDSIVFSLFESRFDTKRGEKDSQIAFLY